MSGSPSLKSLVCEEVFDERSHPSEEEVREYAVRIGIDPDVESHMIPLAREALLKPLPKYWKPVYDQESKCYYYFNFKTKQTSWEHPLDSKFRDLVRKSRSESISSAGEDDSKTSIKEELKSFEEVAGSIGLEQDTTASSKDNPMDFSSQGVPSLKSALSPLRTHRKEDQDSFSLRKNRSRPLSGKSDLKPIFNPKPLFSQSTKDPPKNSDLLRNKTKADWDEFSSYVDDNEQFEDIQGQKAETDAKYASLDYNLLTHDHRMGSPSSSIIGRFTVDKVRKIDIDSQAKRLDSDGASNTHRSSDRFLKSVYGQPEFTLAGGGSVFLKSNKGKDDSKKVEELPKTDSIHGSNSETIGEIDFQLLSKESSEVEMPQRSIKSVRSLTSSPTASASSTRSILRTPQAEKRLWDLYPQHMSVSEKALWKQQELEEEKKSVRFNLDKELNISFKLSDSSDSDSPSEDEHIEDEEDIELNSNGSENLAVEFKLLHKEMIGAQQSPKKQRQLSPLEEWAKETWFSKTPSLVEKASELKVLATSLENDSLSDFSLRRDSLSQLLDGGGECKEDGIQETPSASVLSTSNQNTDSKGRVTQNEATSTVESAEVDDKSPLQETPSQNLLLKENLKLSDIDDFLTSVSPNKFSPLSQDQSSTEANLIASLTKKLKGATSRDVSSSDGFISKEDRAREQAFRDWNVKQTDHEMYRPPLSRQQSQQQLQQIKQHLHESTKADDRDCALRAWNVTDGMNNSARFSKSGPITTEIESEVEKNNITTTTSILVSESSAVEARGNELPESVTRREGAGRDRFSTDSSDLQSVAKDFEKKLETDFARLKMDYEMKVKEKEQEYTKKFEDDQKKIVRDYQEKLQMLIAEETPKNKQKCKEIVSQMERESDLRMKQLREQLEHKQTCAAQKILEQHQQALAAQEVENQAAMLRFREHHSAEMKTLREQFQREEEQIRREHQDRLVNLREDRDGKRSREITDHLRAIEKLRCEKRLVEDKYRILKEKYVKLKGEMKANIEKKEQKMKETNQSDEKTRQNEAIVSDQDASVSQIQHQSDRSSETESRPKTVSAGSSGTSNSLGFQNFLSQTQQPEQQNPVMDPPSPAPNCGPSGATRNSNNESSDPNVPFLGMRFCNPPFQEKHFAPNRNGIVPPQSSRCKLANYKTNERNGNIPTSGEETQWSPPDLKGKFDEMSPLEALRQQLQTLDELEEQFPVSSVTDAYLRYPFSDSGGNELESAELEFFRHRIHLERDMIRQAKSSLQAQQSEYRTRMHNFLQRQSTNSKVSSPGTTLYQMAKEEQELSDMEVKLRRTRTVLSEKMIHLRHLENSLNRLTAPAVRIEPHGRRANGIPETRHTEKARVKHHRRWDWKSGVLGLEDASDDVSSDSGGSSGFSSTEYTSDGTLASLLSHTGSGHRFKRTPENTVDINFSLHNLNAEISEIWNVLCKQRAAAGLGPPPLLNTQASTWVNSSNQQYAHPVASFHGGSSTMTSSIPKVLPDKNSSLIERTNNLRQWLQKAKMSATLPNGAPVKDKNEVAF